MNILNESNGPVADAQKAVEQIEGKLQSLDARQAELTAALPTLEARVDAAMEADKPADSEAAEVTKAKVQLESLARTRTRIEAELGEAKRKLKLAPAVEMRQQAAVKRAELEALQRKTAPLLEKLAALEGVAYDHCILQAQRKADGAWQHPADQTLDPNMFAPNELASDFGQYELTNTRRLFDQARRLEQQAGILEGTALSSRSGFRDDT